MIKNFDEIFLLIKKEIKKYNPPVIKANKKWEKIKKTPFTTLISCILSLRTKDEITEKASIKLLKKYDTPQKIYSLTNDQIQELIYPTGFYRVKSKNIRDISKTIIEKYNGEVPESIDELIRLKGVGRKTANIVMVYGYGKKNYLPVDTHCHRIPNRIGWINTKTPDESEKKLKEIIPQKYWYEYNQVFVAFGQTICLPVSPFCSKCPIKKYCMQQGLKNKR